MTDAEIDKLWMNRENFHSCDLMPQLRDLVRAALKAQASKNAETERARAEPTDKQIGQLLRSYNWRAENLTLFARAVLALRGEARQPLMDADIAALFNIVDSEDKGRFAVVYGFARAIERAHGITGETK